MIKPENFPKKITGTLRENYGFKPVLALCLEKPPSEIRQNESWPSDPPWVLGPLAMPGYNYIIKILSFISYNKALDSH